MSAEAVHSTSALTEQLSRLPGVRTATELFSGYPPHPVDRPLQPLFRRGGLPRGEATQLTGAHAFSLALAACAAATREQQWCAVLGLGEPAVAGIADFGIELDRFVSLRTPPQDWLRVTSILVESFDILIVRPGFAMSPGERNRLLAKVRERRMSLMVLGELPGSGEQLAVRSTRWTGTCRGIGRLEQCTVEVHSPRTGTHSLLLPAASGGVAPAPVSEGSTPSVPGGLSPSAASSGLSPVPAASGEAERMIRSVD
jgi:hypothetical protein